MARCCLAPARSSGMGLLPRCNGTLLLWPVLRSNQQERMSPERNHDGLRLTRKARSAIATATIAKSPMPRYSAPVRDIEHLLEDLTPPQRQAATHVDGPLLIIAGAGSGKTRVITRRVAFLIAQGSSGPCNSRDHLHQQSGGGDEEPGVRRAGPAVARFWPARSAVAFDLHVSLALPAHPQALRDANRAAEQLQHL